MISVLIAGFLQKSLSLLVLEYTVLWFFFAAMIEEILKYFSASFVALKTRFVDEAIDPVIYMVTSALGFAAAENILFLFIPLANAQIHESILTLSSRFVGATLLHIIASGSIGICLGFFFYKSKAMQRFAIFGGITIATILHTAFNSFIIKLESEQKIWIFVTLWIGLIGVIFILEKIKSIKKIKI
jgi:RsiW-degrading membrane proteinase PrsW (M82 family)